MREVAEDGIDLQLLEHNPAVIVGSAAGAAPTLLNPNLDVVYSEAWIAVDEATPAILQIPAVPPGRYYTAQIVDEWAEITHNLNERNFPRSPERPLRHLPDGQHARDPRRLPADRHPVDESETADQGANRR